MADPDEWLTDTEDLIFWGTELEPVTTDLQAMCAGCRTLSTPRLLGTTPEGWTRSHDDQGEYWCPECSGTTSARAPKQANGIDEDYVCLACGCTPAGEDMEARALARDQEDQQP